MAMKAWHSCLGCRIDWTDGHMVSSCPKCGLTFYEWMYEHHPGYKKAMDKMSEEVANELRAKSPLYKLMHRGVMKDG